MRKILILIVLLITAQCSVLYADDFEDVEDRIQELENRVDDLDDPSPRVYYQRPYKLRTAPAPVPAQATAPASTPAPAPTIRASAPVPVPATRAISFGTGVLFNASLQVFTNYHLVNGARKIHVKFVNGETIQAKLSYMDEGNDVAMLTLATLPKLRLKRLTLADASKVKIGEKVFTIGYPASHILGKEPKYSEGIINALTGAGDTPKMFQISVPIQAGNSGGPLFNEKGAVVGLITSTFVTNEALILSGTMPQNVNFAVKSSLFADKALAQSKGIATASIVPVPVPFSVSDFVVGIKNNIVLIEAE